MTVWPEQYVGLAVFLLQSALLGMCRTDSGLILWLVKLVFSPEVRSKYSQSRRQLLYSGSASQCPSGVLCLHRLDDSPLPHGSAALPLALVSQQRGDSHCTELCREDVQSYTPHTIVPNLYYGSSLLSVVG